MKRLVPTAVAVLCLALSASPVAAHHHGSGGNAGDLDPTWQGTGWSTTSFPGADSLADGVAVGRDGRVVAVGGTSDGTTEDFAVSRYNADGSLDTSFGSGGRVTTDFKGGADFATGVALVRGGLVVVGYTAASDGTVSLALARYQVDGSLDPSFGGSGEVVTSISGMDFARAVALSGHHIVVAGSTASGANGDDFLVARYNLDGTLDSGFGGHGWVSTDFNGADDQANAVLVTGRDILVAGTARGTSNDFALARYRGDGSLDPWFGTGGKVETDFSGGNDAANALDEQHGRIVAIGSAAGAADADMAAAVYDWRGHPDRHFSGDGMATMDLGKDEAGFGGGFDRNGAVIAGGNSADSVGAFAVVRWTASGDPDPRFGGGTGHVVTPIGGD